MNIDTARVTISTAPPIAAGAAGAPLTRRTHRRLSPVGVVARVVAGITGAVFGLAIALVSIGFDTTGFLLSAGAIALAFGWFFTVIVGPPNDLNRLR